MVSKLFCTLQIPYGENMNLFASIATYNAILPETGVLLLRKVFEDIILQYSVNPNINFTIQWAQTNPRRSFSRPLQAAYWDRLISKTNLEWVSIIGIPKSHDESTSVPFIDLVFNLLGNPQTASFIEFSANLVEIFGGTIHNNLQTQLVKLLTQAFIQVDGSVGFITVDSVWANLYSTSPYESELLLTPPYPLNYFREKARGYYWGNFLGPNQVWLLGGNAELQKAPVYLAQPLKNGGFYLQLTETLSNKDPLQLQELKKFLTPILPTSPHPPVQELIRLARLQQKPDPENQAWYLAKLQEIKFSAEKPPSSLPEAQKWLEENENPCALAGKRFKSTKEALSFVKKLYQMGATHVSIGDLWDEPWRLEKEGGPYTTSLHVKLPDNSIKQKAFFDLWETEKMNQKEIHLEALLDQESVKMLSFWWD